jgi:hypothetical protein
MLPIPDISAVGSIESIVREHICLPFSSKRKSPKAIIISVIHFIIDEI